MLHFRANLNNLADPFMPDSASHRGREYQVVDDLQIRVAGGDRLHLYNSFERPADGIRSFTKLKLTGASQN